MLVQKSRLSNSETLLALCGPNRIYMSQLILIASAWRDDLGFDKTKLRGRHFPCEKLRRLAEFVISSTSTFGVVDLETVRRLLLGHRDATNQWLDITLGTIERAAELLDESDVMDAWEAVAA